LGDHHHDGRLLAAVSQRRQQPALPVRLADSQMLPSPVELVKLQLHRRRIALTGICLATAGALYLRNRKTGPQP
jgi:hypothetical protein